MLTLPLSVRVFLAVDPVDMRGSFDALAGGVRCLGLDLQDDHLYLFFNRRRGMMKLLFFDGTGWVIVAKRVEQGTFQLPVVADDQKRVAIDAATLAMILEGIDLRRAPRRKRYAMLHSVFGGNAFACPHCETRRVVHAVVQGVWATSRVLASLARPSRQPRLVRARGPPPAR